MITLDDFYRAQLLVGGGFSPEVRPPKRIWSADASPAIAVILRSVLQQPVVRLITRASGGVGRAVPWLPSPGLPRGWTQRWLRHCSWQTHLPSSGPACPAAITTRKRCSSSGKILGVRDCSQLARIHLLVVVLPTSCRIETCGTSSQGRCCSRLVFCPDHDECGVKTLRRRPTADSASSLRRWL
jgi:hypothetical protein